MAYELVGYALTAVLLIFGLALAWMLNVLQNLDWYTIIVFILFEGVATAIGLFFILRLKKKGIMRV